MVLRGLVLPQLPLRGDNPLQLGVLSLRQFELLLEPGHLVGLLLEFALAGLKLGLGLLFQEPVVLPDFIVL